VIAAARARRRWLRASLEQLPALIADETELAPDRREARIGVVLAQQQTVLGAAREHAIGLAGAARDQIIDEHAEVGLAAPGRPRRLPADERAALMPASRPWAAASS
jgi:hypothetical protein